MRGCDRKWEGSPSAIIHAWICTHIRIKGIILSLGFGFQLWPIVSIRHFFVLGVAVIDNLVYAVGGSNRDDGTRSNLNSMERYNPEKDEWEDMPPMHRSRGAASVTALNCCLYAVGGYDSGKLRQRYSPF